MQVLCETIRRINAPYSFSEYDPLRTKGRVPLTPFDSPGLYTWAFYELYTTVPFAWMGEQWAPLNLPQFQLVN